MDERAVGDDRGALQDDGAGGADRQRAAAGRAAGAVLIDAGRVDVQGAGAGDRDGAGVVVDRGVGVEGERAAGQHVQRAGVGDGVVVDRGGAGDVDVAGVVEGAGRIDDQGAGRSHVDDAGRGVGGGDVVQRVGRV